MYISRGEFFKSFGIFLDLYWYYVAVFLCNDILYSKEFTFVSASKKYYYHIILAGRDHKDLTLLKYSISLPG